VSARRERLLDVLNGAADAVLVCEPRYVTYLTGFYVPPFEFRSVNATAFALIDRDGATTLFADNVLAPYAEGADFDRLVSPTFYDGERSAAHRKAVLCQAALEELALRGKRLACDATAMPAALLDAFSREKPDHTLVAIEPILRTFERRKDPDEVALMQRSMRAGEAGHRAALSELRPGMTERDLFLIVQRAAIEEAGEQVQVYGDFVTGPRTESIGGMPSNRKIAAGDLVLLDFSVVIRGYRGDFANTFVCGGEPSSEVRKLAESCLSVMRVGEEMLRAGTECREIDRAMRDAFGENARHFLTHSGHGLGLGHPDPPYIVRDSIDTLVAGDIVTLEPGQYLPGVGGLRYERNYLVTDTGYELLSKHALSLVQS
jgi:Xaa-Pro aminopeptidase